MATSQNGWPVFTSSSSLDKTFAPVAMPNGVRPADVAVVLGYVAHQFHERVEELANPGCWGWAYRAVRGQESGYSNHASATAIDVNAPRHPMGVRGTFTPAQRVEIRQILAEIDGVVRWGGDYTGRVDEMHFEINASPAAVAAVAARIRNAQTKPDPAASSGEDHHMQCKAGTNVKQYIPCNGKRQLFIAIGGPGRKITYKAWFIGNTKGTGGNYLGEAGGVIDTDRPGPIGVPEGCAVVSLLTTCDEDFVAWCA